MVVMVNPTKHKGYPIIAETQKRHCEWTASFNIFIHWIAKQI